MNDEQRAALVEELAEAFAKDDGIDPEYLRKMDREHPHSASAYDWIRCLSYAESCMPIIDRLLADRAATDAEPDAETSEIRQLMDKWGSRRHPMTTEMDFAAEMEAFENQYPMPDWGVDRDAARGKYYATTYNWHAQDYVKAWGAWKARAATVAEPDAETVERVAQAIHGCEWQPLAGRLWDDLHERHHDRYRDMAKDAIAAMPSCADADDEPYLGSPDKGVTVKATVVEAEDVPMFPDLGADADNWLDDALTALTTDGLPGTAVSIYRHDNEWGVQQMTTYLEEPDSPADICGHGATAREAILDAVQKAKEASK